MIKEEYISNSHTRPFLRGAEGKYLLKDVRGIVVHWTANTNNKTGARAHKNYFNQLKSRYASCHYIVDEKEIIQIIPDNELAFHVGDKPKKGHSKEIREKILQTQQYSINNYLIGVEMYVNADGDWQQTVKNTIWIVRKLMAKYNLTSDEVYRHYDITGKQCPKMYLPVDGFEWSWETFKVLLDWQPFEIVKEVTREVIKEVYKPSPFIEWLKKLFRK